MKIVNKTDGCIFVGGIMFIPTVPAEIDSADDLKKEYPAFAEMLDTGKLERVGTVKARSMEKKYKSEVAKLKKGK